MFDPWTDKFLDIIQDFWLKPFTTYLNYRLEVKKLDHERVVFQMKLNAFNEFYRNRSEIVFEKIATIRAYNSELFERIDEAKVIAMYINLKIEMYEEWLKQPSIALPERILVRQDINILESQKLELLKARTALYNKIPDMKIDLNDYLDFPQPLKLI